MGYGVCAGAPQLSILQGAGAGARAHIEVQELELYPIFTVEAGVGAMAI